MIINLWRCWDTLYEIAVEAAVMLVKKAEQFGIYAFKQQGGFCFNQVDTGLIAVLFKVVL